MGVTPGGSSCEQAEEGGGGAVPGCTGREEDEGAAGGVIHALQLHTRRFCLPVVCSPNERECPHEHRCVSITTGELSHVY